MQCFQRAFVPRGRGLIHAVYHGNQLVSVVPVVRSGRLARALAPMANEHSPIWSFALDTTVPYAAEHVLDSLLTRADCLRFIRMRRSDRAARELSRAALSRGLATSLVDYSGDVTVELGRSFDDLARAWSPGMAREARRCLRQRARQPDLVVERTGDSETVDRVIDECFALEARTWKGAGGTAMQDDRDVHLFYRELARTMARRGELALYILRRGDRVVAFDYALRGARRLDSLKIAFDPEEARLSPGNLLTLEMLRRESDERVVSTIHLGRPAPYKARFMTSTEPVMSLGIFGASVRSRAAYLAGPVLRGQLKKRAWAVALHRRALDLWPLAEWARDRVRGPESRGRAEQRRTGLVTEGSE
jgi:CelD/BcsL family acetyltransferase involved in cellulose biosynthesis